MDNPVTDKNTENSTLVTDKPCVGQRVKIGGQYEGTVWEGIGCITKLGRSGIYIIEVNGMQGGFYEKEITLFPLTKLDKALK